MNRNVLAIALGLLAALAVLATVLFVREPQAPVTRIEPTDYFDQSAATEDRIRALETAVAEERNARLLLEDELQALYDELDQLRSDSDELSEEGVAEIQLREAMRDRVDRFRAGNTTQDRTDRLVKAGFAPDRAEWIVQRESALQMDSMQAMFEARQSGERPDRSRLDPERVLRSELGDSEYEQYLEANGRSTSVAVGTVLESSPGQRAGLQAGDEIVGYDGQRVFSYGELSERTMSALPGQSVVVDIVRDGVPMQVVVDAGPSGISNRNIRGRR